MNTANNYSDKQLLKSEVQRIVEYFSKLLDYISLIKDDIINSLLASHVQNRQIKPPTNDQLLRIVSEALKDKFSPSKKKFLSLESINPIPKTNGIEYQQIHQTVLAPRPISNTVKRADSQVEEPVTHKMIGKDNAPSKRASTPVKFFPKPEVEDFNKMRIEMEQMDKMVLRQARQIKLAHHPSGDQSSRQTSPKRNLQSVIYSNLANSDKRYL